LQQKVFRLILLVLCFLESIPKNLVKFDFGNQVISKMAAGN